MRNFLSGLSGKSGAKPSQAKADMMKQIRKGGSSAPRMTDQEKMKKMMQQKMDAMMEQAMLGQSKKYGQPLDKNAAPKEPSKTMQKYLAQMKLKKQQKAAKIEAKRVVVKKKYFPAVDTSIRMEKFTMRGEK